MDGTEDYLPLWLELHLDGDGWLFELRAGEDRAVVVGSHPTADVRVTRHGVASTHFHFERERGGVIVVPGYRAALVVDHVPAPEPATIGKWLALNSAARSWKRPCTTFPRCTCCSRLVTGRIE